MRQPPAQTTDDATLVALAREGDRDAWMQIYRRYVGELFGFCFNEIGAAQDAEDVVAETFMRIVNGLDGFDGRSSFRTWMYTIARNQLRDRWRRCGRRPRTVDLSHAPAQAEPSAEFASEPMEPSAHPYATAMGRAVLAALPVHYGRVLKLRIMDGRSIRDTAEEMGITPGNVKVMQHRALKRARLIAAELEAERTNSSTAVAHLTSVEGLR